MVVIEEYSQYYPHRFVGNGVNRTVTVMASTKFNVVFISELWSHSEGQTKNHKELLGEFLQDYKNGTLGDYSTGYQASTTRFKAERIYQRKGY